MDNNIETEEWRDIEGYEGLYQVSNCGRVKSLDRYVTTKKGIMFYKGKILRPGKDRGGYLYVILGKDTKRTTFSIHRLVWTAFNGQRPEGMQINHIDEDKSNNAIENLNLMTPKENTNWGTGIERRSKSIINNKSKINHKSYSKPIIQLDLECNLLAEFESIMDAERKLGIWNTSICACCRGKQKTAGGYIFRYKEQTQNKAI